MTDSYNILIAGVGGQGNLVCGRTLAEVAVQQGKRPVLGDTFGASRRGGSVLTHLRISSIDLGPLIPKGGADLVLGMEPIEALRTAIIYASSDTKVILSESPVQSPSTRSGEERYPDIKPIISSLKQICGDVYSLDPRAHLLKIGTDRVLNVLMLGFVAGLAIAPFSRGEISSGIESVVGMSSSNKEAFEIGCREGLLKHPR